MKASAIAIVGMAGRFPGARNVREFWQNLRNGVESIRSLSDAELIAAGATNEDLADPHYVKRAAVLSDVELFDAAFFGLSPRDAAIMDPQHRHFLECAWEALEDAAHPPQSFNGSIGVFAGSGMSSYLIHNLLGNRELVKQAGLFQLKQTGNDKDVLATRVSYQFDLRGPSINVQTACSTSLVAVHLACQSLLGQECDMALAGGVTVEIPHGQGYLYREGEVLSRDGRCRSFDAASSGTVFGSGVGIVVLRRLEDAIADRDAIRAVILGSAINNDGARKVGYLAPSVDGQAEVIAEALEFAGVTAEDISCVEAHGTGTIVGDPIEVRALTQAFRRTTSRRGFCAIGSLKTNVGHLDAASGVAALMKTALALEHAELPASLHFHTPNPHIDFADSPFFVNSRLTEWPSGKIPRTAGVTSLGIGGTNAHVVLQAAPIGPASESHKPFYLLTASANSESAVDAATANLSAYLDEYPEVTMEDAAFTCQVGRKAFMHRRAWVVGATQAGAGGRASARANQIAAGVATADAPQVALLFSGQGSQYTNMGRELYEHEAVFREALDVCAEYLLAPLGVDMRRILYPAEGERDAAAKQLNETWLAQPALFAVEYALACWWMSLGIKPAAMLGHSIGEYVAACLAGVFSLEDALAVTAFRGRLMFSMPAGAMLAVQLPPDALALNGSLALAAINGRDQCVVSGPAAEIRTLEQDLAMQSVACRRLLTSHAFHSAMMDPILGEFEERMRHVTLHPPLIPYLSNVSGTWVTKEEATDPAYWASHLRNTVRFSDCLAVLGRTPEQILIEVGPGNALTALARQEATTNAFQSLTHAREAAGGLACALHTVGELWVRGVNIDWENLHTRGSACRVSLPTYPFEHKRFWIDPDPVEHVAQRTPIAMKVGEEDLTYYKRVWKHASSGSAVSDTGSNWMIFKDAFGLGDEIAAELRTKGHKVVLIEARLGYVKFDGLSYAIRPGSREDYDALFSDLRKSEIYANKVIHLWPLAVSGQSEPVQTVLDRCFFSPVFLAQVLAEQGLDNIDIALVSDNMQQVFNEQTRSPERAVLLGPARVIPLELSGFSCRSIDVEFDRSVMGRCAEMILSEMTATGVSETVAYRGGERFVEGLEPIRLAGLVEERRLQQGGVYLITGGTGGIGLAVAEHLAAEFNARLVLVSRSAVDPETMSEARLSDPGLSAAEREKIERLMKIGALARGLLVVRGDVTEIEQMKGVAKLARERFGHVDGVFHAAGVLDDGPLMLKTAEGAGRVLDAKVRGTLVLEEVFRDTPLRCFVLFSSISSIFPAAGQVDYAAANAFLDAFALSRKGKVTVINWGAWREVGMAARGDSAHPLLRERLLDTLDEIVYGGELSVQKQFVLAEHKLRTDDGARSLLPGTSYMEMAAAAYSRGRQHSAVEFRDVFFLAPFLLDDQESREVRVQLKKDDDTGAQKAGFRFAVYSHKDEWVEHCSGTISECLARPENTVDRAAIERRCVECVIVFDKQHKTRQERLLEFGPRWHSLRTIRLGKEEGLAEIELDESFSADIGVYRMHPALLDLATGVALYLTRDYEKSDDLFLPISYKKLCLFHSLPAKLYSHIRSTHQGTYSGAVETFDITLFDAAGQVLAEIEGFCMRRVEDIATMLQAKAESLGMRGAGIEQPIEMLVRPGIDPEDGVRALVRILSVRLPHGVVAVAGPLTELEPNKHAATPRAALAKLAITGDTIEGAIAVWWQEMLGVQQVKPDDDFFALGGHSLVGVRFLAAIKKAYGVDLELGALFDARTPRGIAEVISNLKDNVPERRQ